MRLIIVTVGFDEKLPLRGLLKLGIDVNDTVLLIYSKTGGDFKVKKVEKAVEALKDVVSKAGSRILDLVVSGSDFYGDVSAILSALRGYSADEVVAVLAGGTRILVFEVLSALLLRHSLASARSRVYVAREDGLYDVILPIDMFYVPLSSREDAIIRKLYELGESRRSQLVDAVSRETGLSESMIYKVVRRLARKGLVTVDDDSIKLTELGRLVYEVIRR